MLHVLAHTAVSAQTPAATPATPAAAAPAPAPTAAKRAVDVYQTKDSYIAAYHYLTCPTSAQAEPASTQELAGTVAKFHQTARAGAPVTLRTSRPKFHSTATFVCPTSTVLPLTAKGASSPAVTTEAGSSKAKGAPAEVGVLQSKMNKVLAVDSAKYTMRVGAGMTINELLKEATKNKMSVQVSSGRGRAGPGGRQAGRQCPGQPASHLVIHNQCELAVGGYVCSCCE